MRTRLLIPALSDRAQAGWRRCTIDKQWHHYIGGVSLCGELLCSARLMDEVQSVPTIGSTVCPKCQQLSTRRAA